MDKIPRHILYVMVANGAIYGRSSYHRRKGDRWILVAIAMATVAFLVLAITTY